jgi:hypothetical protein
MVLNYVFPSLRSQFVKNDACILNKFFVNHAPAPVDPRSIRIKQMEKVHADETIVVCTHGGCMLVLEAALAGTSAPHPA